MSNSNNFRSKKNNKITRGTDNENRLNGGVPKMPAGNNEPQDPLVGLQNVITGSIDDLIKSVNGVNDKLAGVLGGIFGDKNAAESFDAKHYLGKIGQIKPANTVFGGLYGKIDTLTDSVSKLANKSINSVSSDVFIDTTNQIQQTVDEIHKAIATNIVPDNTSNNTDNNTDNTQQNQQAVIGTTIDKSV